MKCFVARGTLTRHQARRQLAGVGWGWARAGLTPSASSSSHAQAPRRRADPEYIGRGALRDGAAMKGENKTATAYTTLPSLLTIHCECPASPARDARRGQRSVAPVSLAGWLVRSERPTLLLDFQNVESG